MASVLQKQGAKRPSRGTVRDAFEDMSYKAKSKLKKIGVRLKPEILRFLVDRCSLAPLEDFSVRVTVTTLLAQYEREMRRRSG